MKFPLSGEIGLLFVLSGCTLFLPVSRATAQQVNNVWPGFAPGTQGEEDHETIRDGRITNVYQPDIKVFLPARVDVRRPGIPVLPGGGYTHLATEKEGYAVAQWLNDHGIAAFVLKYRLDPSSALQDAQRSMRLIRSHADEFNIDRSNLGVMGFSAGGHLAANLAAHPEGRVLHDVTDSGNCRPEFMVLAYGDIDSLIGSVNEKTPPTFLVHTNDDTRVPVRASVGYYMALHNHGVPAELHVYERGKHGFGLLRERGTVVTWMQRRIDWLKVRKVLGAEP